MNAVSQPEVLMRSSLALLLAVPAFAALPARAQVVERIGFTTAGQEPDASATPIGKASISPDGRFVCYASKASNLVVGDGNSTFDVFWLDRATGVHERMSVSASGVEHGQGGLEGQVSPDGARVLLRSYSKLVPQDNRGFADVFLRNRTLGTLVRVSVGYVGQSIDADVEGWAASRDLSVIAFQTRASNMVSGDTNGNLDLIVRDMITGTVTWVTTGNMEPYNPSDEATSVDVTADGTAIAFASRASHLVPGDANGSADIFVWTRATGSFERVSIAWSGAEALGDSSHATISDDGRYVAFQSAAHNLAPGGDGNGVADVFVRDRLAGTTIRASLGPGGIESASPSVRPVLARDGSFVAFESEGALLPSEVAGSWKLYRRDLVSGVLQHLVVPVDAQPFTAQQTVIGASPNAMLVASGSSNLVPYDPNGHTDLFLVDLAPATARTVCAGFGALAACPCSNTGGIGHGCTSSFGGGGPRLVALGEARVGADTLTLDATILPPGTSTMFLQGSSLQNGGNGTPFGDGLRCVAGVVVRLGQRTAPGGWASLGARPGDAPLSTTGGVPAVGGTRYYQAWFRNSAVFCTTATFGFTNASEVTWGV